MLFQTSEMWTSAFLATIQERRALECAFIALNSTGTHCHAYRKYTGSLRNTDGSIIQTCSGGLMMSTIEGFRCKVFLLHVFMGVLQLDSLACKTTLLVSACFCKLFGKLSYCLGHRLFVRQACTAFMLFGLLINHSASSVLSCLTSFWTVWPGFWTGPIFFFV